MLVRSGILLSAAMNDESQVAGVRSQSHIEVNSIAVDAGWLHRAVVKVASIFSGVVECIDRPPGVDTIVPMIVNALMIGSYGTWCCNHRLAVIDRGRAGNYPDFMTLRLGIYVFIGTRILAATKMQNKSQIRC